MDNQPEENDKELFDEFIGGLQGSLCLMKQMSSGYKSVALDLWEKITKGIDKNKSAQEVNTKKRKQIEITDDKSKKKKTEEASEIDTAAATVERSHPPDILESNKQRSSKQQKNHQTSVGNRGIKQDDVKHVASSVTAKCAQSVASSAVQLVEVQSQVQSSGAEEQQEESPEMTSSDTEVTIQVQLDPDAPDETWEIDECGTDVQEKCAQEVENLDEETLVVSKPGGQDGEGYRSVMLVPGGQAYQCTACQKTFKTPDKVQGHVRIHTGEKPFCCSHCGSCFAHKTNYLRHVKIHSDDKDKPYKCYFVECDKAYMEKKQLQDHVIKTHSVNPPLPKKPAQRYPCDKCDVICASRSSLTVHVQMCHDKRRDFVCNICDKAYQTSSNLKRHMISHSGLKRFECPQCKQRFTEKKSMIRHVKTIHLQERNFECEMCGKAMTSQASLNQHITSIHENKYAHQCRLCGTAFKIKSNLRNHYSTVHIKEKLRCPEDGCDATFNSRSSLQRHRALHTAKEKIYTCEVCHMKFTRAENYHNHAHEQVTAPNDLPCPNCDKAFMFKSGYYKHIKRCMNEAERIRKKYDYASILGLPKLPKQALTVKDMIDIREQGKPPTEESLAQPMVYGQDELDQIIMYSEQDGVVPVEQMESTGEDWTIAKNAVIQTAQDGTVMIGSEELSEGATLETYTEEIPLSEVDVAQIDRRRESSSSTPSLDMPVQHIEVDASTLKARSRVVLTQEEAQLLTKVNSAEGSTDKQQSAQIIKDGKEVYIIKNEETGQMEIVKNFTDEQENNEIKLDSAMDTSVPVIIGGASTGRGSGQRINSNQPQVKSLMAQVSKERMTQEVISAVNSIQQEDSSLQNNVPHAQVQTESRRLKTVLVAQHRFDGTARNPATQVKTLQTNNGPTRQKVAHVKRVTGQIPSIPVRGMQSLLKINQSSASQMVLKPETLKRLKDEGVKGIRTRHIVYVVPKGGKCAPKTIPAETLVQGQGRFKVIPSPATGSVLDGNDMQGQISSALSSAHLDVEPTTTNTIESCKIPRPVFVLPCIGQDSPSKYIAKSYKSVTPATLLASNTTKDKIPPDGVVLQHNSDVVVPKAKPAQPQLISNLVKIESHSSSTSTIVPATCVQNFIPDMTTPTKYTSALLPEMGVGAIVVPSEVDPYDIDKLIKDIQDDDVIGAENPINEQDLEFMRSIQSSPTDSIIQAATEGQDAQPDAQNVHAGATPKQGSPGLPTRGSGSPSSSQHFTALDWD